MLIFQLITGQLCSQPSYDRLKDEQFLNGHFLNLDFIFEFYFCFSLKEVCTHALLKTWVLFPFLCLFTCAYLDGARLFVYNFVMFCFRNNKSLISIYCHIFFLLKSCVFTEVYLNLDIEKYGVDKIRVSLKSLFCINRNSVFAVRVVNKVTFNAFVCYTNPNPYSLLSFSFFIGIWKRETSTYHNSIFFMSCSKVMLLDWFLSKRNNFVEINCPFPFN